MFEVYCNVVPTLYKHVSYIYKLSISTQWLPRTQFCDNLKNTVSVKHKFFNFCRKDTSNIKSIKIWYVNFKQIVIFKEAVGLGTRDETDGSVTKFV